jgi:thiol:disulfide interchange protein
MTPTTRTAGIACVVMLLAVTGTSAQRPTAPDPSGQVAAPKFDPSRDSAHDLRQAVAEAQHTHKRIILDVGGEWCSWCHTLDRFYAVHADLTALRDQSFVWLKVNWSPENQNKGFLSRYPAIKGYPHLFVLEQDGTLLHSQDTSLLEEGPSYNLDKMTEFLKKWASR